MKKKAVMTFDMIMYIPRMFFIIIVAALISYIIWSFIALTTNVKLQETHVLSNNIIYSTNGLAYQDHISHRTYPGVIDPKKFDVTPDTPNALEIMFNHVDENDEPDNDFIAMKVILSDFNNPPTWNKMMYLHESNYNRWADIAVTGLKGAGGTKLINFTKYVLVKEDDKLERAKLTISFVMPND